MLSARRVVRPDWDTYYLEIVEAVSARSNCIRRGVGAIIVRERAIVSTGYNGTPSGVRNCSDGGCSRCSSGVPSGQGYDTCICVHAEQNAISLAARYGNSVAGGVLYCSFRPCFHCIKLVIQAGLKEVVFEEDYLYPPELEEVYGRLVFDSGVKLRKCCREEKEREG